MSFTCRLLLRIKQTQLASRQPPEEPCQVMTEATSSLTASPLHVYRAGLSNLKGTEEEPVRLFWPVTLDSIYNSALRNGVQWDEHSILVSLVLWEQKKELCTLNLRQYTYKLLLCIMWSGPALTAITHFFLIYIQIISILTDTFMINLG